MPSLSLPCWDFHFLTILRHPEERATGPREGAFSRPPLAESVIGARSFAGASEGCCVGRAWIHREAAGGQVGLGSRRCFLGMLYLVTKIFSKILLDITTTTTTTTTR